MYSTIQVEPNFFLQLISNNLLHIGKYGRIINIHTVKTIAQVCKQWQAWIYSPEGPFSRIFNEVLNSKHIVWIPIDNLNDLLEEQGTAWFNFVDNYKNSPEAHGPQNTIGINCFDENEITPLHKAIVLALQDKKNLPLISNLINHGADPSISVCMKHANGSLRRCNHFAYIFFYLRSLNSEQHILDDQFQVAFHLGKGFIQGDLKGENLFHYVDLFANPKRKSFYAWYSQQGANINQLSHENLTPLHKALQKMYSNFSAERYAFLDLIDAGASVNVPFPNEDFPIHFIVKEACESDIFLLESILFKSPSQVYSKDARGYTPLWWAIQRGKTRFKEKILSLMDRAEIQNNKKYLLAQLEFLKTEITEDWWCDHIRRYLYTSLKYHCWPGEHTLILKEQLDHHLNLLADTDAQKKQLLKNSLDSNGNTFYHRLANLHPPLLKLLLSLEPHVDSILDLKNFQGETVQNIYTKQLNTFILLRACEVNDVETAKRFLDKAVLGITDKYGNNLLHLVLSRAINQAKKFRHVKRYAEILKLLLDKGVNPNACNSQGETPLHYLYSLNGWVKTFEPLLLAYGAKLK